MSGFSTYEANLILNDRLVTPYASRYLALFVADPTDANITTNEISAGWYGRQPTGSWASPSGGGTQNNNAIQYNAVTGSSVSVTHWGIYDASSGGNLLYSGAWDTSKTLNVDDIPVINAGDIDVALL